MVVVSYEGRDLLAACLRSVEAELPDAGELVVVDNGSTDGSPDVVRDEHPRALLIERPDNPGFGAAVNEGVHRSTADWILVLNNDVTLRAGSLAAMLRAAETGPDVGAVAPQMRFARRPELLNGAGLDVDRLGVAFDRLLGTPSDDGGDEPEEVFGASGGAALLSRRMFEDLGGFDTTFFLFLEDVDLAWRARMGGWRSLYAPSAVVEHHHSAAAGHGSDSKLFLTGRNRVRLLAKNMPARELATRAPWLIAYDLAYSLYGLVVLRSGAPIRGRMAGLRQWRRYRLAGAPGRRSVRLAPVRGLRGALDRNRAWRRGSAALAEPRRDVG